MPLYHPKKNREGHFVMSLKQLNFSIIYTKVKMTTEADQGAICPGQWAVPLDIKPAYCLMPVVKRPGCFLCFRWK